MIDDRHRSDGDIPRYLADGVVRRGGVAVGCGRACSRGIRRGGVCPGGGDVADDGGGGAGLDDLDGGGGTVGGYDDGGAAGDVFKGYVVVAGGELDDFGEALFDYVAWHGTSVF